MVLTTSWHGLLANTALVALFISIWTNVRFEACVQSALARQICFGILFGLGAVTVMQLPFQLEQGVSVDLRTTMVAVAGFFGGPISGLIAAAAAAAFRVYLGGAGLSAGLLGIGVAATVGIGGFLLTRGKPTPWSVVVFAAVLSAGGTIGIIALPRDSWAAIDHGLVAPIVLLAFVTTLMASLAILNERRRRETSRANHLYKLVIDSLPDFLNVRDLDGHTIIANPAETRRMRSDVTPSLSGRSSSGNERANGATRFQPDEQKVLECREPCIDEQSFVHGDERPGWLSILKAPLTDAEGRVVGLITHRRDVSERKQLEAALAESERKATAALTTMADGLVIFDQHLRLVFCNEQYRAMFPLTADLRVPGTEANAILYASIARGELIGIPEERATEWVERAVSRLRDAGTVQFPLYDGRWIESRTRPAADGSCYVVCSDVTRAKEVERTLRDLNDRLSELAVTDGLTGLLNRRAFDQSLAEEVGRAAGGDSPLSLLLIDIDRFKAFNDAYGHMAGDDCLRAVADCLRLVANRPEDRAARYGGEEMALILPGMGEEEAIELAQSFREHVKALDRSHLASEKGVVTVSVGVATVEAGRDDVEPAHLVRRADEALYAPKAAGRDQVRSWEPRERPRTVLQAG